MQNQNAHPDPDSPQTAAPPANNGTYAAEQLTNADCTPNSDRAHSGRTRQSRVA